MPKKRKFEDAAVVIEEVDSDEEAAKSVKTRAKHRERENAAMDLIKQCIVDYLKHIGEDGEFFPDGIRDVAGAFELWSHYHCLMTECQSSWSRVRNVFVGSSHAYDLFRKPSIVLRACAPYNMAAGLVPYQPKLDNDAASKSEAVRMGIAMEDVIRKSHVALFSKPLETAKPGRVVSTHGAVGMSCTADIELLDEHGEVAGLMEVKTMYKAKVPPGLSIPDTAKKARMFVRDILATHGDFSLLTGHRANIFRQKSRFVDLNMLKRYGLNHTKAHRERFAVHSHVRPELFLECCMPREGECVNLYFYEAEETNGDPAQVFSMQMSEFGLAINPWCATTWQMLIQQCVYRTCCCRTISKEGRRHDTWMHLVLVVPYDTDVDNPAPYLIMDMPVHFSDSLCEQFERFYAASACEYVGFSTPTFNDPILRARYRKTPTAVSIEGTGGEKRDLKCIKTNTPTVE
jgi:hypothetical protein